MPANYFKPENMSLKVLCDENLPNVISAALNNIGCDVKRVVSGMSDVQVANLAQVEERIIITFDSDFANILVYPPKEYFGIVRISIHPPTVHTIIERLNYIFSQFTTAKDFQGKLIIIGNTGIRIWNES